jgi:hypothetical protein
VEGWYLGSCIFPDSSMFVPRIRRVAHPLRSLQRVGTMKPGIKPGDRITPPDSPNWFFISVARFLKRAPPPFAFFAS